jgi:peptidoglycan/LPS O-acetylase OafA/YrhL
LPQPEITRLDGLTHLRALAITLVFFYHYGLFDHPPWVERVGAFGWTGVDLFFVLSGFLISRQLFRSIAKSGSFSLSEFYFKRLLRILPAYFVVLACYFWFRWTHEREALPPLWKFLTFTQNLGLDLRTSGTFSHAWSLCIEEQFYLLLPLILLALLAMGARRRAFWLLPLIFALGFVTRLLVYLTHLTPLSQATNFDLAWYEWIYYPTWSRLDGLVVGIALAALNQFRPMWFARVTAHGHLLLSLAIALWVGAYWLFVEPESLPASVVAFPAIAIVYGALLSASLSPACLLARHSWRPTHWLATLSYAFYLSHKACVHIAQRGLARAGLAANGNIMFVCCLAASLLGALALHLTVERPFLRWRDRVLQRRRARLARSSSPALGVEAGR